MVVSSSTSAAAFDMLGRHSIMYATALETGGAVGIWEAFPGPGEGVEMHVHTCEDEVFRVLSGTSASGAAASDDYP